MAIQGQNPNSGPNRQGKSRFQKFREVISRPKPNERIADDFGILKEVAGLRYLQNIKDTEQRRTEIVEMMEELNDLEFTVLKDKETGSTSIQQEKQFLFNAYKLAKLFQLYFITGSPWVRGSDNETLSVATAAFIENFEDVGDIPGAFRDLHAEATYLLHLSWQGIDVTNTPAYVISSTPIFAPQNIPRVDLSGGQKPTSNTEPAEKPTGKHEHL
ncbi:MAG: hypothetical protein ABSA79_09115 [Candidatus Bathyarchaeia archaeon]|jgi:hypothetical protein